MVYVRVRHVWISLFFERKSFDYMVLAKEFAGESSIGDSAFGSASYW
jgi:hypothetical protein